MEVRLPKAPARKVQPGHHKMRWFVLGLGLFLLGGLTAVGYGTMIWLAYFAGSEPTPAQVELLDAARELVQNGAIMLGAFIFGWLAGQVR